MTFDWQDMTALAAVAIASTYLAWRGWLTLKRKRGGCGGCGTCPSSAAATKTVVTIDLPPQNPRMIDGARESAGAGQRPVG